MGDDDSGGLWRRIAGDGSHLGFWTLPVFVATALGGAVIAGTIANVYYGQQVAALEEETAAARTAAEVAAEEIDAARQEALDAIAEQVDSVRDAIEVARPLADPAAEGIVALAVELTPDAPPSPEPSPAPSGTGGDGAPDGAPLPDAGAGPLATTAEQPAQSGPPAPVPGARIRNAVGFVIAVADGEAFVATSHGAVRDPNDPDGVAPAVTVTAAQGSARGIVHAWDRQRGVAVVRVALADLPILPWRPEDVPVDPGDVVVLAAVTPGLAGVQLPGRVGAVADAAMVTDLPADPLFDGAPVLDSLGRVVGLQASTAAPFGAGASGILSARRLCVELLSGCGELEQADESDETTDDG